ncbi:MAG: DUF5615 family PIN-like protein [Candidatus Dormibacteraeota bacterium]|nr:DUF5615 family PIN-like protein [Candidatus Dormibacteraeota bacterium]
MGPRVPLHRRRKARPIGGDQLRLLLDAHISSSAVGKRLREPGHDVFALDEHADLEGIDDPDLLELATSESRILVTHNVRDFPDILRAWAEGGRNHAGCVIVVGIALNEFGPLFDAIEVALGQEPSQNAWVNRPAFASRG